MSPEAYPLPEYPSQNLCEETYLYCRLRASSVDAGDFKHLARSLASYWPLWTTVTVVHSGQYEVQKIRGKAQENVEKTQEPVEKALTA